jgi:hypothetical protein
MAVAEIVEVTAAEIAEAIVLLAPEATNIPILGKILLSLSGKSGGDTAALEELQKQMEQKKTDRKTRIQKNARYVLKASDAMQCVETHIMESSFALKFAQGILNALTGKGGSALDLLTDEIFLCIEEKVLRQDTPRVIGDHKSKYVRPRKGHGHGRTSFGRTGTSGTGTTF